MNDEDLYNEFTNDLFNLVDVKSAVEWLKMRIQKYLNNKHIHCHDIEKVKQCVEFIDDAFPDIYLLKKRRT